MFGFFSGCNIAGCPGIFAPLVCEEAARDPVFLPVLPVCSSRHDASNLSDNLEALFV